MSQAGIISASNVTPPPAVPTSFVTDVNSPAIPVANILNVVGGYVITDNVNGIQTDGSSGSNTETIQLTNRFQTSVSYSDAVQHTIYSLSLGATPAVYLFQFTVVAFNSTSSLGAVYNIQVPIRTDGATATGIVQQDIYLAEEGAMSGITISGGKLAPNSFFVSVQGYNSDTIKYNLTGTYTKVS